MSLSDFMPYGAPELLEGASPRMARSTFAASALVASLVWCLGLVAAKHPALRAVQPEIRREYIFQPEIYEPKQPVGRAQRVKVTPAAGEFQAVVAEIPEAPAVEPVEPAGPVVPGHGGEPDVVRSGNADGAAAAAEPLPGVYVYSDEVPQLVRSVKPYYPDLPREAGVEGTVKLQLLIGLDGRVRRAIVRPGGSVPMLDEAAIAAALQCVFTPALANHRPVMVWVTQDYRFTLH